MVTEGGLFQYYHAKDAKVIRDLHKASNSMVIRGLEEVRGTAFAGDFSPLFGVQMPLAFMANPYGVVRSLIGAVADSAKAGDVLRSFRTSTLADVVADDLDGWADLSFTVVVGSRLAHHRSSRVACCGSCRDSIKLMKLCTRSY